MQPLNFENAVRKIVAADDRYQFDAYLFVQEAIDFTQKSLGRKKQKDKHVGGKELLNGLRELAVTQFGPMAATVLAEWGIRTCEDFGEIVYTLIQHKQASQSPSDSREDFKDGYDFDEAFCKPFRPAKRRAPQVAPHPAPMIPQE